jgi:hypothetical protein
VITRWQRIALKTKPIRCADPITGPIAEREPVAHVSVTGTV